MKLKKVRGINLLMAVVLYASAILEVFFEDNEPTGMVMLGVATLLANTVYVTGGKEGEG